MTRIRRFFAAIPGAVGVLCLLVGAPVALVWFDGDPFPRHWPTSQQWEVWFETPLAKPFLKDVLTCFLWLMWAVVLYVVLATIVSTLAKIRIPIPKSALSLRAWVGSLAGASVIATNAAALPAVTTVAAQTAPATGPTATGDQPHTDLSAILRPTRGIGVRAPTATGVDAEITVRAGDRHFTVTVHRDDTLWDLAGTWLGDPHRWTEIYHLNRSHYDQHGRMRHGNLILPGWVLILPDDATPPPGAIPAHRAPAATHAAPIPLQSTAPAVPDPKPTPTETHPAGAAPTATAAPTVGPSLRVAASPTPAPPAATHPSATPADAHPSNDISAMPANADSGVEVGDAGWVTLEVAAGVAAAAALLWMHRRRRYRPQPVTGRREDPDLRPLPRSIAALHRARTPAEDPMNEPATETPQIAATVTTASLGTHTGHTVLRATDLPPRGVGLIGDGAAAASRGMLVGILSAGGPWAPDVEAAVITTRADIDHLLPGDANLPALERLHIADTLDEAFTELELQLLRRARVTTANADVLSDPTDPDLLAPPLVFATAAPTGGHATRLAAILAIGSRLSIFAVLTGPWADGETWQIDPHGHTTSGNGNQPGRRLNVLDPTTTIDILTTLHEARPDNDDLPAPATQRPHSPPPGVRPEITEPSTPNGEQARPPQNNSATITDPRHTSAPVQSADSAFLDLRILGRPTLMVDTADGPVELRIRRSDGLEILLNLAVNHPHGMTSEQLMEAVWPGVRPHTSRRRLHTTMRDLRLELEEHLPGEPIPRTNGPYRLNPAHVQVDLWRLTNAIGQATTTLDPAEHETALREFINLYHGTIAEGHSWLWLAPHREALRRHMLDAHVDLADTAANPQAALAHIQNAIQLDPYNEDIYQRAMYLHAKHGNLDGIRRTIRALSERLAELEIRISPQTQQIAADLAARIDARHRHGQEQTP